MVPKTNMTEYWRRRRVWLERVSADCAMRSQESKLLLKTKVNVHYARVWRGISLDFSLLFIVRIAISNRSSRSLVTLPFFDGPKLVEWSTGWKGVVRCEQCCMNR